MNRQRLPNRRASETFELEVSGLKYTCTVSRFADGRIAELFLTNHKSGSHADACARDSAIAASLALQFGCPVEILRNALLRNSHNRPATPLVAALDIVAREVRALPSRGAP
jgi:hypothetical protein